MVDEPGYTINVEADHILVRHNGALNVPVIEASRREVAALATALHLKGILLDLSRATSSLKAGEIFELCTSQVSVLPARAGVAVVIRPDQFSTDDASFAETVSENRGFALRTFIDAEAARQWLSTQPHSE